MSPQASEDAAVKQIANPEARCSASEIKRLNKEQMYEVGHLLLYSCVE